MLIELTADYQMDLIVAFQFGTEITTELLTEMLDD